MTAYIILLIFVLFWYIFTFNKKNKSKANKVFLNGVFIYLYIFCVIRGFHVGRDVPGYISSYDTVSTMAWDNWKVGHFEIGYIFLMKICNIIGLSARGFFCIVYFIILWPLWLFLRRESPRPFMSIIVFLGFQFFVFDLTGLRQAMAMSFCILAYMSAQKKGWMNLIMFIILVVIGFLFHKSVLAFLITYFIIRLPLNLRTITCFAIAAVCCTALNQVGVAAILDYYGNTSYGYSSEDNQQLGLTLVFIILFAVMGILLYKSCENIKHKKILSTSTLMVMTGVCAMCLANGSTLLRASMYFYFPIVLLVAYIQPQSFGNLGTPVKIALIAVLLFNFFFNELNYFDVTPYEIATDLNLTKSIS